MKVGALCFWSDEEDGYIEFMYDKIEGILVLSEDESTSSSEFVLPAEEKAPPPVGQYPRDRHSIRHLSAEWHIAHGDAP